MTRLAYLVSQYPKASHSFIRREIHEIERRGHDVLRCAIREPDPREIVDEQDLDERRQTWFCLRQPWWTLGGRCLVLLVRRPRDFGRGLRIALAMWAVSDRGLIRHLAYFVEAVALGAHLASKEAKRLHVHFGTNEASVARILRAVDGVPYSLTVHGPAEFDAPIGLSLQKKIEEAEFVCAISSFTAAQLKRWADHSAWPRIHVVYCTVPDRLLSEGQPVPDQTSQLVCVGRLSAQKGQRLLLEAAARLKEAGAEFRLVLAGGGEDQEQLEQQVKDLDLTRHVVITGWIDQARVCKLLAESRAMVLPSFAEGLPVAIMEAFALRRPVISSYVAGIPELVQSGVNGWLVPAGDPEALADAMRSALEAPVEALRRMGEEGQRRVAARHVASKAIEPLERLFLESTR